MKTKGLAITLFALGLAITTRPMHGQTISFFRQFTTAGMDRATAVAADASGIYVIGNRSASQGRPGVAGIRKYDSRSNILWTREITPPAPGSVVAGKVLADTTGIYVFGYVDGPSRFLSKYSLDGDELWAHRLESPSAYFRDVAVDATGVYVASLDFASSGSLRKYNPDGTESWTRQLGEPNNRYIPFSVTVDTTGVYLFGVVDRSGVSRQFPFARKYDLRGNELWTRQPNWFFSEIPWKFTAANPTGYYIAAVEVPGLVLGLRKYDADGNEIWSRRFGTWTDAGPTAIPGVAADATGVYVSASVNPVTSLPGHCRSGSGGDSVVRKYSPNGAEMWTRQFGTADGTLASGVAVDDTGVYVVGQEGTAPFQEDWGDFLADATSGAFLARFEKTEATLTVSGPRIFSGCVVNAASYVGGGVAPGEIVTIFGSAMGPPELVPARLTGDRRLAATLADTRILFNGVPAPLFYVSDKQSSAIVPYGMAGQSFVDVQAEYKGVRSEAVTVPVLTSRPGIFSLDGSGRGQGAILNEDGSLNSPSNPARRGSVITLFATGGGEAAPGVVDGQIVSGILPRTSLPVSASFDIGSGLPSKQAEVLYAGGVPGSVAGLLQVNLRVPANAVATGNEVQFALIVGSHWTAYQITLALR